MEYLFKGKTIHLDKECVKWFDWNQVFFNNGYLVLMKDKVKAPIHQMIIGKAPKGKVVDHINRNKLDNRRENLRFITQAENIKNSDRWDKILEEKIFRLFGV